MKNPLSPSLKKRHLSSRVSDAAPSNRGFAIVVTLTLMILLTVIAIGLLSLGSISLRNATQVQAAATAQSNARMALMLALGELQKAAGPDQRITAAADVRSASSPPAAGRAYWTGVWKSDTVAVPPATAANYSPKSPNSRSFVGWLVSSRTPGTSPDPDEAATPTSADDMLIFQGADADGSVKVPKVEVTNLAGNPGKYAYWVEDEGVKANLGWSEGEFSDDARKQAARLSAAPGPDPKVFEGPFTGIADDNYPISASSAWIGNLHKALSVADMPLVMGDASGQSSWLREKRHDITLGSLGVMADVKLGGLRRDLSLAFEMDGTATMADWDPSSASFTRNNLPAKFNAQFGEFVGKTPGSDVLTGGQAVDGLTARYLYGDNNSAGFPFSAEIPLIVQAVRGPTWFALRDYANAYKRLSGSSGNYMISSRPTYPNSNSTSSPLPVIEMIGSLQASAIYDGYNPTGGAGATRYLEKPFQPNYAPVLLGYTVVISVMSAPDSSDPANEKLALGIDPIFFLWNPYNRHLKADRYLVSYRTALPGYIGIWLDGVRRPLKTVREYVGKGAGFNPGGFNKISYSIKDVDLAPGEVKVFSPPTDPALASAGSRHPYNTDALPGADLSSRSGAQITQFPISGNNWGEIKLSAFSQVQVGIGMSASPDENFVYASFPTTGATNASFRTGDIGANITVSLPRFYYNSNIAQVEEFRPSKTIGSFTASDAAGPYSSASIRGSKQFCGVFSMLTSPAKFSGPKATPVEVFARFNPLAQAVYGNDDSFRAGSWNQEVVVINQDFGSNYTAALEATGIILPAIAVPPATMPLNGYWGNSYAGDGSGSLTSTVVPAIDIPTGPLMSLAHFAHANLGILSDDPMFTVGSSLASVFIDPVSPYGEHAEVMNGRKPTASDSAWLLNDALFDRYYLSGIAPDFTLEGSYQQTGTLNDTLTRFFSADYQQANANPVLRPYLPPGTSKTAAVDALTSNDGKGYLKMGAYSLIDGMFNVNSTAVGAWTAFLRANKGLNVVYAQGGNNSGAGDTPFPRGTAPVSSARSAPGWSGLSRLSDPQIDALATEIVKQVKLRGPFMSLSDFVNHRVGTPKRDDTHYMGALQAAIEASGINSSVNGTAGGTTVNYGSSALSAFFKSPIPGNRPTTTGIVTDITQTDLLMSLAPRLGARSDTFRIRAYGEALSKDGKKVLATATCEAIVQRLPEYMDPSDDPWLEANYNPYDSTPGSPFVSKSTSNLNDTNQKFGRRFHVVDFRWLSPNEI